MKPSEAIREAAEHYLAVIGVQPTSVIQAEVNEARSFIRFVLEYLDATEERLAALERRTSSTEYVTLHSEPDERGFGKSYKVKWHIPYEPKEPA